MNVKLNTVNKTRNLQNGPKLIRCLLHGILFRGPETSAGQAI